MSGPEFFQTRMGARFFEATAPKVADQLERLNGNLEALVTELRLLREERARAAEGRKATDEK